MSFHPGEELGLNKDQKKRFSMRGVATLLMLEEFEKRKGAKTYQMFDLIVWTSTGAI